MTIDPFYRMLKIQAELGAQNAANWLRGQSDVVREQIRARLDEAAEEVETGFEDTFMRPIRDELGNGTTDAIPG